MAIEEAVNLSEISSEVLWPLVSKALSPLITLAKVLGVIVLVYLIYITIKGILGWRRNRRIDITYEKVLEIDKKLDELLKRTAKKEKALEKPEKKKSFFVRLFGKREKREKKVKEKK